MILNAIFTDNMVLQANKTIYIFGEGEGKANVTFLGKNYSSVVKNGKWEVAIPAQAYGGPYEMKISLNGEEKFLKNVMVGEVILCAGQSNMQFTIEEEVPTEPYEYKIYKKLRFFNSDRIEEYVGIKRKDGWVICAEETLKYWTAIGYHVAKLLHENKGIAVGVIGCYQGASILESWVDEKIISRPEYYVPEELRSFNKNNVAYPLYSKWNIYGKLYKETFYKIVPFAVGNVLWYQGESNATVAESKMYANWLKALVDNWREDLRDENLTFIIFQIADLDDLGDIEEGWCRIQKAQEDAISLIPNTKLVITKDVSETTTIHPADKRKVAERAYKALWGD